MCDPVSLMVMTMAAGGAQAISSLAGGFANSNLAKISAQVAGTNKALAEGQVGIDEAKGALDIGRTATAVNRSVAAIGTRAAASHLDPTFGTPLFQEAYATLQGEGDKSIIGARTASEVAHAKAQAASAQGEASAQTIKGMNDIMTGYIGAGTALVTSTAQAAKFGAPGGGPGKPWPWQTPSGGISTGPSWYPQIPGASWYGS
jgi:hypothetical protein